MKRIFTLSILLGLGTLSFGQRLVTEDFNYALGGLTDLGTNNVSGGNWTPNSGTGNYLQVTAGSLTYPNYFTSPTPTSNKLSLVNFPTSSEDAFRSFTPQNSGTVYASALIKVNDVAALDPATTGTGDYFFAFLPSANTTAYLGRVYIRKGVTANTYVLGVSASTATSGSPVVYGATEYTVGSTHLITVAFQFVAGATNDIAKLFVDAPYSATEPLVPHATSAFISSGTEQADVGRVAVRQGAVNNPTVDIDAIKVSTIYADAALPLSLTSFKGSLNGKTALLKWTTFNEVNLHGFSLERSVDGKTYTEINFTKAINTIQQNNYGYTDINVANGVNYYRLKMLDKDGQYNYSSVVVMNNRNVVRAEVFPNPVANTLTVSHPKATNAVIRIVTAEGRELKKYAVETGAIQTGFPVSGLTKGTYLLIYDNDGAKSVTKFVKQ